MIASHAEGESEEDNHKTKRSVAHDPAVKILAGKQRFVAMLEHRIQLAEPTASRKFWRPAISKRERNPETIALVMPGPS